MYWIVHLWMIILRHQSFSNHNNRQQSLLPISSIISITAIGVFDHQSIISITAIDIFDHQSVNSTIAIDFWISSRELIPFLTDRASHKVYNCYFRGEIYARISKKILVFRKIAIKTPHEYIRVHTSDIRVHADTYGNMRVVHEYIGIHTTT